MQIIVPHLTGPRFDRIKHLRLHDCDTITARFINFTTEMRQEHDKNHIYKIHLSTPAPCLE